MLHGNTTVLLAFVLLAVSSLAQQPAEPTDMAPLDGETYYLINQLSGLQADLSTTAATNGTAVIQQTRSFTSLSQRWAMTRLASGTWKISNLVNGLCMDNTTSSGVTSTVQNACALTATQQWSLSMTTNGYYTLTNSGSGLALHSVNTTAGSGLNQTAISTSATQSQQWLLRPVFFRGVDNALLEKQEANKVANGVPWWTDGQQAGDLLQILKNHGVNMVRIRPTSVPPYATYTSNTCFGNGCYAETDAQDIDLARRARKLGMSVELSLFFDGGSSVAVPGAWSADTLTQAKTDLYNYVKSEVESFREAGVMPDLVAIGNEVDTGFLNSLGSSPSSSFSNFAALEIQGMQAVLDAASDTSIGAAIPAPLRCIHITPADNMTSFFTSANSHSIPYDVMCQSYYPLYHGPLTAAQAAATNPSNKPVEQTVITAAANSLGKPIFLIEVGEHYESGFGSNDPWYPATVVGQRQFLIDVTGAEKGLPNNLGMGIDYWDATGVNIFVSGGGYSNADGKIDSIYAWNGLTLFDNADTQGYANAALANFSATLPGLDALGGRLDPSLNYKLVNQATGQILETTLASTTTGAALDTVADTGIESLHQQWIITSNFDGYFKIANANSSGVLDSNGTTTGAAITQNTASAATSQEWNVVTAGGGYFALVNKSSGQVLTAATPTTVLQTAATTVVTDWVTAASTSQLWKIVPAHISVPSTPAQLLFTGTVPSTVNLGAAFGTFNVAVANKAGATIGSPAQALTLTVTGPNSYSQTYNTSSSSGTASFNLTSVTPTVAGTYTAQVTATGLTAATTTVTANNQPRPYGTANPTLTYGISGFVNGHTSSVVSGTPSLTGGGLSQPTAIAINPH